MAKARSQTPFLANGTTLLYGVSEMVPWTTADVLPPAELAPSGATSSRMLSPGMRSHRNGSRGLDTSSGPESQAERTLCENSLCILPESQLRFQPEVLGCHSRSGRDCQHPERICPYRDNQEPRHLPRKQSDPLLLPAQMTGNATLY